MRKIILWSAAAVTAGLALALPYNPAEAQRKRPTPERRLLGVSLGSPMLSVMRMFQAPNEVQTVALSTTPDSLPGLSGGGMGGGAMGGPGMEGMGAMGGMGGGYPGMGGAMGAGGPGGPPPGMMAGMMGGMGGGRGMGGMAGAGGAGGVPSLPNAGGAGFPGAGGPGMGGMMGGMGPGMAGMGGMGGAMGGPGMGMGPGGEGMGMGMQGTGGANLPEYSNALLLIYKNRPIKNGRMEFLINEDGQVAQISLAAPAGTTYNGPGGRTARRIGLASTFQQVVDAYGYPERHRLLPGFRFYEAYYSKNYHAAFTFDTQKGMKVVRITIALAD